MVSTIGSIYANSFISLYKEIREQGRLSDATNNSLLQSKFASDRMTYNAFSFQNVLQRFGQKTNALITSLNLFSFNSENLPQNFRTAIISDEDTGKITADVTSKATITSYLVDIDQLAMPKTRQSRMLASDDITDLEEGDHSFTLTVGDNQYSLSISINKTGNDKDTNKDVFRKIKWAIDSVGENIDTDIFEVRRKKNNLFSDDYYENAAYLSISSKDTGSETDFFLEDNSGIIVDSLDLNKIIQTGRTSVYKLDTRLSSSSENTVLTDHDNLIMTFLDTTGDAVRISVRKGLAPVAEKAINLIFAYNEYIDWLDLNSQYITSSVKSGIIAGIESLNGQSSVNMDKAGSAVQRLSLHAKMNNSGINGDSLQEIGLELKDNGKIEISGEFSEALENHYEIVKNILSGEDGLFNKIGASLNTILDMGVENFGLSEFQSTTYNQKGYLSPLKSVATTENRLDLFI